MRRLVLFSAIGLLLVVPASVLSDAQTICPGLGDTQLTVVGDQKLTVSNTAVGLTTGSSRVQLAVFSLETDSIRYRVSGSNPTSSDGHLVTSGSTGVVCGLAAIRAFRAIRVTNDATLYVTYYRPGL